MPPTRSSMFLLVLVYLGFVSLGLPDGTFGVAWPAMYPDFNVAVGLAGTVTLTTTLLSGASGFASGGIVARFGTGPVVVASCALTGLALLGFGAAPSFAGLMLAAIPLGLGAGAVDAGLNGFVARSYSGRHMNWLHACWGVGATAGPLAMSATLAAGSGWRTGYFLLGGLQVVLGLLLFATLSLWKNAPTSPGAAPGALRSSEPETPANSLAGWLSPALFAVYVAVETTVGVWAATILVRDRGFATDHAAAISSAYYASITIGRIAVGFAIERIGNRPIIRAGCVLALIGLLAFANASSATLAILALAAIGLGFAPIYPGLMHEVPRRFASAAVQTVIGRQSGAAYLGAASLPALTGLLAQQNLSAVPWLCAATCLLLIAGILWLDQLT